MPIEILRSASDFNQQTNILVGGEAGDGVIYTRPQVSGQKPYSPRVEYELAFATTGNYQVWIEYASNESRPSTWTFDGSPLSGMTDSVTGGWTPLYQKWEKQGIAAVIAGLHRLVCYRDSGPTPHIRTIKFLLP